MYGRRKKERKTGGTGRVLREENRLPTGGARLWKGKA